MKSSQSAGEGSIKQMYLLFEGGRLRSGRSASVTALDDATDDGPAPSSGNAWTSRPRALRTADPRVLPLVRKRIAFSMPTRHRVRRECATRYGSTEGPAVLRKLGRCAVSFGSRDSGLRYMRSLQTCGIRYRRCSVKQAVRGSRNCTVPSHSSLQPHHASLLTADSSFPVTQGV